MLILTRRIGETIVIGGNINVTVLGVKGNQVRLGVKAPKEVPVDREEIALMKKAERLEKTQQGNSFEEVWDDDRGNR